MKIYGAILKQTDYVFYADAYYLRVIKIYDKSRLLIS